MPGTNDAGINTASKTSEVATIGPVTSCIAIAVAFLRETLPFSICRSTFSTTTIASSTTSPIASTSPKRVSVLMEKPNAIMMAKAPISETGIAITGIIAARQLCKKIKITSTTSPTASSNVTTSSINEMRTNSEVSKVI